MKKSSKRRVLFAVRTATMIGAAWFAVNGITDTLGQEKEKSRPVYIATEGVAEATYTPEAGATETQPTETAKATEEAYERRIERNRRRVQDRILRVKSGEAEPDRCELCDCCRHNRVLTRPISIMDLTAGI